MPRPLDRRRFVQTSALVGGSLLTGSILIDRIAHATPERIDAPVIDELTVREVTDNAHDAYAARKRGDYDAMVELCAAGATLRLAGDAEYCAMAGTTRVRVALRAQFVAPSQFAFANQKMLSLTVDGDHATVRAQHDVQTDRQISCDLEAR
ncbi:MAG TPA: twin-arginine translocation signal domain-containing protein [Rhizomicrobium sp.]|nr:twin-arginine translocation signal domain-containing protein [Rhizomicrobium sp.]